MRRRLLIILAASLSAFLLRPASANPSSQLTIVGQAGKTADLDVSKGGLDLRYDMFPPRLEGPDNTVAGVVIQRRGSSAVAGGVLVINAPGLNRAVAIPLRASSTASLSYGHYSVTLLGSGFQRFSLRARGLTTDRVLLAGGATRAMTRVVGHASTSFDSWSERIGVSLQREFVVVGAGGGGELQQAGFVDACLRPAGSDTDCLGVDGTLMLSPGVGGSGTWTAQLFPPQTLRPGDYTYSGAAAGVGPSSKVGHIACVIVLA